MKKIGLFLVVLMSATGVFADDVIKGLAMNIESIIQQTSSKTASGLPFSLRLSSEPFKQVCLTGLGFQAETSTNVAHRFALLDGYLSQGTTIYEVAVPSSTVHAAPITFPDAMCSSMGNSLTLNSTIGQVIFNFRGYIKKNR